jgi:glutathione synthase/RimK-type ligase-like ATP-grasp enzyme
MLYRIKAYKLGSASAKELKLALMNLGHRVLIQRRQVLHKLGRKYLNWGCQELPDGDVINQAHAVRMASNKTQAFAVLVASGVPCVDYTVNIDTAREWLEQGETVIARALVQASGGRGITVVEQGMDMPHVPLYTKYFKKLAEYRVHVFKGEVIKVQQKLKKQGVEHDSKIRNHDNGYVFASGFTLSPDPSVLEISVRAVQALELDFGAVDIGWNQKKREARVFEVNTAPGLTSSTAALYADAIINLE